MLLFWNIVFRQMSVYQSKRGPHLLTNQSSHEDGEKDGVKERSQNSSHYEGKEPQFQLNLNCGPFTHLA